MARKKDKEIKTVELMQGEGASESNVDSYDSDKSPVLVNSELNELVHPPGQVPSENVPTDTPITPLGENEVVINGWIDGVELLIQDKDFQAYNPQSHRIMGAVINMLKSARDHLGDK